MSEPLVSVIVPCYNQGHYLPEAVASLQAQTYPHWECLIINDGSTDNTAEIGAALAEKDSRVRLINQPNRGLAAARNRGLSEARGQFIQFLDADDIIKPTKFELQLSAVTGVAGLAVSYCDYYRATEQDLDDPRPKAYMSPKFKTENYLAELASRWETQLSIPCHCFLFDARFFTEHGIRFDEDLPNHEDWDCWMRIFALKPSVHYVDAKLAVYRLQTQCMCKNLRKMRRGFLMAIDKQIRIHRGNPDMLKILKDKRRETIRYYANQTGYGRSVMRTKRLVVQVVKRSLPDWMQTRIRAALGRT